MNGLTPDELAVMLRQMEHVTTRVHAYQLIGRAEIEALLALVAGVNPTADTDDQGTGAIRRKYIAAREVALEALLTSSEDRDPALAAALQRVIDDVKRSSDPR